MRWLFSRRARRNRTVQGVGMLAMLALVAAGCGSDPLQESGDDGGGEEIVVGSANFPENRILMHIYAGALRNAGATVSTQPNVGAREVVVGALQDGSLDVVPEYTGNLLQFFNSDFTASSPDEVYQAASKQATQRDLQVLQRSEAVDSDVLVTTQQLADEGISSMADLGPRCSELVLGASSEWKQRWVEPIKQTYGCEFKEIRDLGTLGPNTFQALKGGDVDLANMFTTTPQVAQNDWVELDDPKDMYPPQNVVPLQRADALNDQERKALNTISAKLTTDKLTELNLSASAEKMPAEDIASDYLSSIGMAP